jgi:hypothetical protein
MNKNSSRDPMIGLDCIWLFDRAVCLLQVPVERYRRVWLLPSLVDQAIGEALSDILLVDAILQLQGGPWKTRRCSIKILPVDSAKSRMSRNFPNYSIR